MEYELRDPEGSSAAHKPEGQAAEAGAGPEAGANELDAQLARAREDAQRYLANWQRAEADFRNYKRRTEQERDESRRFALASLTINLLPVLDDFERAFGSLDARLAGLSWFEGIFHIYRKLQAALQNTGVSEIEAENQAFDPRFHEAVAQVEGEEGKIVGVVQKGYKLHDRVLRPATVLVGKGRGEQKGPETGKTEREAGNIDEEGEQDQA